MHKNNRKRIKKNNFETNLIRLTSSLILFLILAVLVLYYASIKSMYSEQLEKSNESVTEQVAISFEAIMSQITDGIYKLPLYDDDLIRLINNTNRDMLYQVELQKKLDNVVFSSSYLYSSYLYLADQNIVYSSETANSYSIYNFPDIKAIGTKNNGTIRILDPRVVDSLEGRKLLISVTCPIPLYQGDFKGLLVVNIDANKLYYDVLRNIKTDESMNFYVYNKENTMVINKDAYSLDREYTLNKTVSHSDNLFDRFKNFVYQPKVIKSSYYSEKLHWNFVLETSINSASAYLSKVYSIGIFLIVLLILSLVIVIWIIKFSTKPMKKALSSYNEKLWIDFLTENAVDSDTLYKQLELDTIPHLNDTYVVFVLQLVRSDNGQTHINKFLECIRSFLDNNRSSYDTNIIVIHKNQIAILVNSPPKGEADDIEKKYTEYGKLIFNQLDEALKAQAYLSISTIKENAQLLPIAYKECLEALNYKINFSNSHILQYSNIKGTKQELTYEYPLELERQLNNNLIVANTEACEIFLEKFFGKLAEAKYHLSDNEIKTYIYQLQTSILKTVGSLPIPIKIESSINILDQLELEKIKTMVSTSILNLATEINKSGENKEIHLINCIFDFIDKNLTDKDFNLNIAADSLNLNRNYLAKIIKEKSGYSFNEYVNKMRIKKAKDLLTDKILPIETISHEVGFNYSHYFIKVFKNIEGITPGQYRDNL